MLPEAALTSFIAALFSVMNPIGNVGIFAGMTADQSPAQARKTAIVCALACTVTLLAMVWAGSFFLAFFGLTIDTLRAAGGVIVLLIGLHMLSNNNVHRHTPAETDDATQNPSVGVVPLAIPIVAGPGTMATVLVASQEHHTVLSKLEISLVVFSLAAFTGLLFSFAAPISRRLGVAGMGVVTRVMGMVLAAIAMGMLADGLKGMLPGLAG
jgi:multiple antibiotic resistance protein